VVGTYVSNVARQISPTLRTLRWTAVWSDSPCPIASPVPKSFSYEYLIPPSVFVHPLNMLRRSLFSRKALAYASAGTLAVAGGGYFYLNSGPAYPTSTRESRKPQPPWLPPSREQNLNILKASGSGDELDLLIVGGGATGAGVAVDAASRGLKVALVERDDFSSGMTVNVQASSLTVISNLAKLFLWRPPQEPRRNLPSLFMGAFVTYKRRSWNLITSSTSWSRKRFMSVAYSFKPPLIYHICSP
jgi:hypothetical protein